MGHSERELGTLAPAAVPSAPPDALAAVRIDAVSKVYEAEAATRGCDVAVLAGPGEGAAAALLAGAGWQAAGDAVADGRRLWRRELA